MAKVPSLQAEEIELIPRGIRLACASSAERRAGFQSGAFSMRAGFGIMIQVQFQTIIRDNSFHGA